MHITNVDMMFVLYLKLAIIVIFTIISYWKLKEFKKKESKNVKKNISQLLYNDYLVGNVFTAR